MAKHPAIFLDRDETIIEDNGYINNLWDVEFYPYTFNALQNLQKHFLLFIITNQSGISKGLISENEVKDVDQHIVSVLKKRGITIFDVFYCPHKSEENCDYNEPKSDFIHYAARLYNTDLTKSFMIGDQPSDFQCGINVGVTPIYSLSGLCKKHQNEIKQEVRI